MTQGDASLFELLCETLPMSAAIWAANYYAIKKDFVNLSVQDVHPYIGWIPPNARPFGIPTPPLEKAPRDDVHRQRLWTFDFDPSDPATVSNLWCRVNNAGFSSYKVLERIEWGYEDMASGIFEKAVLVTTSDEKDVKLPLTPEFVHSMFLINNGYLPEGENPLWSLEMFLDRGLVIALVYEIGLDHEVTAWKGPADDAKKAYEEALKDVLMRGPVQNCAPSPSPPPRPQQVPPKPADPNLILASTAPPSFHFEPPEDELQEVECSPFPWGARMVKGKFMPKSKAHGAVSGQVPANESAAVTPMKVLVVLSLATCRERCDYEPGGVVGMARIYPHIMVRADADLLKIEATVRYDRPEKTERKDDGLEGEPTSCCKGYDAVSQEINATLVTDANDNVQLIPGPTLPFWGNMFNYYQTDAYQNLGGEKIKVVSNDKRGHRSNDSGIVARDVVLGVDTSVVQKMPRQAEFDNIHMAPKLRMVNVTHLSFGRADPSPPPETAPNKITVWPFPVIFQSEASKAEPIAPTPKNVDQLFPVDRAKLGLDDISMAPFCAHDCFHMHWRWGAGAEKKWTRGWNETSPYMIAGAPLVPTNQEVYIWLRGASKLSVHHIVGQKDGSVDSLEANDWQITMHQGAAYAVQIEGWLEWVGVQLAYDALASPPTFFDMSGDNPHGKINIFESTAMFYWYSRWHAVSDPDSRNFAIVERLRASRAQLAQARAY